MTNTAKPQLTHFFKDTFSKALTLALSLLIAFSFNAFAVANPQSFNKDAYLDLSKSYTYNWNNSQPVIKKDNQATTHHFTQRSLRHNSRRPRFYQLR